MRTENKGQRVSLPAALLGAITATVLPVLVGLFFLGSLLVHRPALQSRTWLWLQPGRSGVTTDSRRVNRLTATWAIALVIIGLIQAIGAAVAGLSVFDPIGLAIRSAIALVCGALVYTGLLLSSRQRNRTGPSSPPK
jgi:hypothetical protein